MSQVSPFADLSATTPRSVIGRPSRGPLPQLIPDPGTSLQVSRETLRRGLITVTLLYFVTRLIVWAAAYTGAVYHLRLDYALKPPFAFSDEIKLALNDKSTGIPQALGQYLEDFAPFMNWDAYWYRKIIVDGYEFKRMPPGTPFKDAQFNIAFFPLYPLTAKLLTPLLTPAGAMTVISQVCGLLAALLFYLWCVRYVAEPAALLAVACLLCWPTACFLSFGYPESMTLMLTVLVLLLADRRRYGWAAVVCGLATASRPTAMVLVPVLVLAYLMRSRVDWPRRLATAALLGCIGAAGAIAYAAFLTVEFGSPSVYTQNFNQGWVPPMDAESARSFFLGSRIWDSFKYIARAVRSVLLGHPVGLVGLSNPMTWNMPCVIMILFLCLGAWKRVAPDFRPWLLIAPLIFVQRYLVSGWSDFGMESMARYVGLAAPAYLVLAAWVAKEWKPTARTILFCGIMMVQMTWAFMFGMNEWAG